MKSLVFFTLTLLSLNALAECRSYSFYQAHENAEPKRIPLTYECKGSRGQACVYLSGNEAVIHGFHEGFRIVGNDLFKRKVKDRGEILEITMKNEFPITLYYARSLLFELHKSSGTAYLEYQEKGSEPYFAKLHLRCTEIR